MIERHQCCAIVYEGMARYPCGRKGTNEVNGRWYCWQHDPLRNRNKKETDRQRATAKKRRVESNAQQMYEAIKEVVGYVNVGITPEQWQTMRAIIDKIEKED